MTAMSKFIEKSYIDMVAIADVSKLVDIWGKTCSITKFVISKKLGQYHENHISASPVWRKSLLFTISN